MVDGLYSSTNLNSDRYGNIDDTNDQYYFYDRDNDGYINETEYVSALMDEIVFQIYLEESEQATEIPVEFAFLEFPVEYNEQNMTINWFDVDGNGGISIEEYRSTVGQEIKWNLDYTELRSYENEITSYQWFNILSGTQANWDWINKDNGDTISLEEYIQSRIELLTFSRIDTDGNEEVTLDQLEAAGFSAFEAAWMDRLKTPSATVSLAEFKLAMIEIEVWKLDFAALSEFAEELANSMDDDYEEDYECVEEECDYDLSFEDGDDLSFEEGDDLSFEEGDDISFEEGDDPSFEEGDDLSYDEEDDEDDDGEMFPVTQDAFVASGYSTAAWYYTAGYLRDQIYFDDFLAYKVAVLHYEYLVSENPSAAVNITTSIWGDVIAEEEEIPEEEEEEVTTGEEVVTGGDRRL